MRKKFLDLDGLSHFKDKLDGELNEIRDEQSQDLEKITEIQGKLNGIGNVSEELAKFATKTEVTQGLQTKLDRTEFTERMQSVTEQLAEKADATSVEDIKKLIPTQATESNKLADKDFVNSSIATNTAEFKGTFTSLEELQKVTADTNDYGFVVSTDLDGNTVYNRYKYVEGEGFRFEYALNNSSFTAAQWAAINSAITSGDVEKLKALQTKEELDAMLMKKQDVIDDLATIRSGAAAGMDSEKRLNAILNNSETERFYGFSAETPLEQSTESTSGKVVYNTKTNKFCYQVGLNVYSNWPESYKYHSASNPEGKDKIYIHNNNIYIFNDEELVTINAEQEGILESVRENITESLKTLESTEEGTSLDKKVKVTVTQSEGKISSVDVETSGLEHAEVADSLADKLDITDGMGKIYLKKNKDIQEQMKQENTIYVIQYDFDLGGKALTLPENCVLDFDGGMLKNGSIVGNDTNIISNKTNIFSNISIKGNWIIETIYAHWFSDVEEDNKLKEVFNLSSDDITNTIIIEEGNYTLSATEEDSDILLPKSNTRLIINGTLKEKGHSFNHISLLRCFKVSNVIIEGNGTLIGEKHEHGLEKGEHNHGIFISDSFNIIIRNLEIRSCFGDCICIGGSIIGDDNVNTNVIVENCKIHDGRRQGISVIYADNVLIQNCYIYDIEGTAPQAGIDIEPNANGYCHNVTVKNCYISNTKGYSIDTYCVKQNDNNKVKNIYIEDIVATNILVRNTVNISFKNINAGIRVENPYTDVSIYNLNGSLTTSDRSDFLYNTFVYDSNIEYKSTTFSQNIKAENCNIYADADLDTFENIEYFRFKNCAFNKCVVNNLKGLRLENSTVKDSSLTVEKSTNFQPIVLTNGTLKNCTVITHNKAAYYTLIQLSNSIVEDITIDARNGVKNSSLCASNGDFNIINNISFVNNENSIFTIYGETSYNFTQKLLNKGNSTKRPTPNYFSMGFRYYDTTLKKPIYWNGTTWVDSEGYPADAKKSGVTSDRPNLSGCPAGYQYYDTDLSKFIAWNGSAWVNVDGTALT